MNGIILGSLGVYALMVGLNGNSGQLLDKFSADSKGFFPWAVSAAVLAFANEYGPTKPLVAPFLTLAILTFIVKNFESLKKELSNLFNLSQT